MAQKKTTRKKNNQTNEILNYTIALLSLALIIIALFKLAIVGLTLNNILIAGVGLVPYYFIMIQLTCFFIYMLYQGHPLKKTSRYVVGSIILSIGLMLLWGAFDIKGSGFSAFDLSIIKQGKVGLVQLALFSLVSALVSINGTYVVAIVLIIIGCTIYFMISISSFLKNR
ncbi:MAG: hypothetical protein ACRCTA_02860, partial [Bacilli bacterium]